MVCLTGLEVFCDDPALVKAVELQACSKILAVEILERSDIPLFVLYDTSGEDDININATCLKALYDKSFEPHLQVPSASFLFNSLEIFDHGGLRWTKNSTYKCANFVCMCPLSCQNLTVPGRCTIYKCQSNQYPLRWKSVLPAAI